MPDFPAIRSVLHRVLHAKPLLGRWILANIVGWSAGLYAASLVLSLVGGIAGLLISGAAAGLIAGLTQMAALQDVGRRWMLYSTIGGIVGVIPVFVAAFTLIAGRYIGLAIMGAVFGLCFGWMQSHLLDEEIVPLWIMMNVLAGCSCSMFSLTGTPFGLPIFCTFGPVSFGLITGLLLVRIK